VIIKTNQSHFGGVLGKIFWEIYAMQIFYDQRKKINAIFFLKPKKNEPNSSSERIPLRIFSKPF